MAGQCLLDIAIQHCGSVEAWPSIAIMNGLTLSALLVSGQVLQLPDVFDKRAKKVIDEGAYQPSTGDVSYLYLPDGIGYWFLELDFIVT